jgi:hypothetical protein
MRSRPRAAVADGGGVARGEGDADNDGLDGTDVAVAVVDGDGATDSGAGPLAHPAASSVPIRTSRRITSACA